MSSKLLTNLKIFAVFVKERKEKKKVLVKITRKKEKSPRGNGNLDYHDQILNLDNQENRIGFDRNREALLAVWHAVGDWTKHNSSMN